jgi:hypothetical protein
MEAGSWQLADGSWKLEVGGKIKSVLRFMRLFAAQRRF